MTHADAMTALYNASGKTIKINSESFTVKNTRITFGGGVCITLDRPRPGRSSRLFTLDNNSADIAVALAKTIAGVA